MRILIYRLGSLGDTVVALPCFRLVRQVYPEAHLTVLTNAPVSGKAAPLESILQDSGLIDDVLHYPVGLRNPAKLGRLIALLRHRRFDLVISLTAARGFVASIRDYFFFKACGIPQVIGLPFAHRDLVCQPHRDGRPNFEAESERLLRRIHSLGNLDLSDAKCYDLGLTTAEGSAARQLLDQAGIHGKFIAISIGTKLVFNDWGLKNWQELLREVSRCFPETALVLLGSADEFERSEALLSSWNGPGASLCGKAPPRVSAVILREACLFIGHDSGPMHLAAAVGTRCVTIYSAFNPPGQWFPIGQGHMNLYPYPLFNPTRRHDSDYQRMATASIQVKDVLAAVRSCLS